jgi:predicted metalloprotease with PDZ domain
MLSGYKLTYTDKPTFWSQLMEGDGSIDARYSLGMTVNASGIIGDTLINGIAYLSGLAPGFHIVAVNGRGYTTPLLRAAIHDATGTKTPIELIIENTGYYKVVRIDYHGGERYPELERVEATPARLDDILKPMTK